MATAPVSVPVLGMAALGGALLGGLIGRKVNQKVEDNTEAELRALEHELASEDNNNYRWDPRTHIDGTRL